METLGRWCALCRLLACPCLPNPISLFRQEPSAQPQASFQANPSFLPTPSQPATQPSLCQPHETTMPRREEPPGLLPPSTLPAQFGAGHLALPNGPGQADSMPPACHATPQAGGDLSQHCCPNYVVSLPCLPHLQWENLQTCIPRMDGNPAQFGMVLEADWFVLPADRKDLDHACMYAPTVFLFCSPTKFVLEIPSKFLLSLLYSTIRWVQTVYGVLFAGFKHLLKEPSSAPKHPNFPHYLFLIGADSFPSMFETQAQN